jgi:hypothetical protein
MSLAYLMSPPQPSEAIELVAEYVSPESPGCQNEAHVTLIKASVASALAVRLSKRRIESLSQFVNQ